MQALLNRRIKFRKSFRPFAPIVLAERASEYFDLPCASPFMLFTAPVAAGRRRTSASGGTMSERLRAVRSDIPAVTHVDGSARVQTVDRTENPFLHRVLSEFDRLTGCPVLINTSFNVRGEPPVCHPREAIEGFLATGMDMLVLGSHVAEKSALPPGLARPRPSGAFDAD